MSLDEQKNKYRALHDWFNSPQGQSVGDAMATRLLSAPHSLRGHALVQLGHCGSNPWLASLPFTRQWLVTPCLNAPGAHLIASLNRLPFDRNSVDCVVAPLTMEAFGCEKNPLDEIDRILKPMGHVIFFGINPCSLWGLGLRTGYVPCFGDRSAQLMSSLLLMQALFNRGYRQCMLETFYYIPPVKSQNLIEKFAFLNEMGKMIAPNPAGFYCLIVQKTEPCSPNWVLRLKARALTPAFESAWAPSTRKGL